MTYLETGPYKYPSVASQKVLSTMYFEAIWDGQKSIGLEYLLLALSEAKGISTNFEIVLDNLGIEPDNLKKVLNKGNKRRVTTATEKLSISEEVKEALELAQSHAKEARRQAEPEDLLLASTWVPITPRFEYILNALGVDYERFREEIQDAFRE